MRRTGLDSSPTEPRARSCSRPSGCWASGSPHTTKSTASCGSAAASGWARSSWWTWSASTSTSRSRSRSGSRASTSPAGSPIQSRSGWSRRAAWAERPAAGITTTATGHTVPMTRQRRSRMGTRRRSRPGRRDPANRPDAASRRSASWAEASRDGPGRHRRRLRRAPVPRRGTAGGDRVWAGDDTGRARRGRAPLHPARKARRVRAGRRPRPGPRPDPLPDRQRGALRRPGGSGDGGGRRHGDAPRLQLAPRALRMGRGDRARRVVACLDALYAELGEERYRVSPALRLAGAAA